MKTFFPHHILIESNFGSLLVRIHVLKEGTVHIVRLLLDNCAKLEKLIRNRLVGTLEDVDQSILR